MYLPFSLFANKGFSILLCLISILDHLVFITSTLQEVSDSLLRLPPSSFSSDLLFNQLHFNLHLWKPGARPFYTTISSTAVIIPCLFYVIISIFLCLSGSATESGLLSYWFWRLTWPEPLLMISWASQQMVPPQSPALESNVAIIERWSLTSLCFRKCVSLMIFALGQSRHRNSGTHIT